MGRREDRAERESTWSVYEPQVPGTPMTQKDVEDANERSKQRPVIPLDLRVRALRECARIQARYPLMEMIRRSEAASRPAAETSGEQPPGDLRSSAADSGADE